MATDLRGSEQSGKPWGALGMGALGCEAFVKFVREGLNCFTDVDC